MQQEPSEPEIAHRAKKAQKLSKLTSCQNLGAIYITIQQIHTGNFFICFYIQKCLGDQCHKKKFKKRYPLSFGSLTLY